MLADNQKLLYICSNDFSLHTGVDDNHHVQLMLNALPRPYYFIIKTIA